MNNSKSCRSDYDAVTLRGLTKMSWRVPIKITSASPSRQTNHHKPRGVAAKPESFPIQSVVCATFLNIYVCAGQMTTTIFWKLRPAATSKVGL